MKIELIFQNTAWDGALCAWLETKPVVVDIPDELKDYHLIGGIVIDEQPKANGTEQMKEVGK